MFEHQYISQDLYPQFKKGVKSAMNTLGKKSTAIQFAINVEDYTAHILVSTKEPITHQNMILLEIIFADTFVPIDKTTIQNNYIITDLSPI